MVTHSIPLTSSIQCGGFIRAGRTLSRNESSAPGTRRKATRFGLHLRNGFAGQDDAGLPPENFQQHGHALAAFELFIENRFEAGEWTFIDAHGITRLGFDRIDLRQSRRDSALASLQ